MPATRLSSPRLRELARRTAAAPAAPDPDPVTVTPEAGEEACELCGAPVPGEHRHLAEVRSRRLLCVCRPCSLLFDRAAAADGRLRLIPDRPRRLARLVIDEALWARLDIPVQMAFFIRSSLSGHVEAFCPSPLGPTESALELAAYSELEAANPALAQMATDVEALLVNRTERRPGQWIVPVDECYRLVALIRSGWRGFSGGGEVWEALDAFFDRLDERARPAPAREPAHTPTARRE